MSDLHTAIDVFAVDVVTNRTEKRVAGRGMETTPVWVDQDVFFVSNDSNNVLDSDSAIYRYDRKKNKTNVFRTDVFRRTKLSVLYRRQELLLATRVAVNRQLYLSPISASNRKLASPENMYVIDYSVAADEDTVALILSSADTPPEIYIGSLHDRSFRKLTDLYAYERETLALAHVEKTQWSSKDGKYAIDGFLIKPSDFDPKKKYPLLVNIHGGPAADFVNDFHALRFNNAFHSQLEHYAANGYLVLNPNHRGGASYGSEFMRALKGHFTDSYDLDVDPGVDYLIAQGIVDEDRIALMGASYGGYATAWGTTRNDRYAAASINDGMFNLYSHYHISPPLRIFYQHYMEGTPIDKLDAYLDASPLFHAQKISTPTLLRCGVEPRSLLTSDFCTQSVEFHSALRDLSVPAELMIHPFEGHGIIDRETAKNYLVRNVEWFRFWMDGVEDPDPTKAAQYARWSSMRDENCAKEGANLPRHCRPNWGPP